MSLAHGDHLVIKRNGTILGPEDEAYHEFVVTTRSPFTRPPKEGDENHPDAAGGPYQAYYDITMQVVK